MALQPLPVEVIKVLDGNSGKEQKETQSVLTFATKLAKP